MSYSEEEKANIDRNKANADNKAALLAKLDACLLNRLALVADADGAARIKKAYKMLADLNVHRYLTNEHPFTNREVEALLEFADPLEVATACWEANSSADFDICDLLDKINAKAD